MSWRAEYLDTVEAEHLKRLGPRRQPMPVLAEEVETPPEPEPETPPEPTAPAWLRMGRVHILRGRCVYCGHGPTTGDPMTCTGHGDLPDMDPLYEGKARK